MVHGDPLDASASLVEITTHFRNLADLTPEQALGGLAHRDAAVRRGNWCALDDYTGADPPRPAAFSDGDIVIEEERCAITVLTLGTYQAAGFTRNGIATTVATRHCAINQLCLARVPAIEPYLDGYKVFLLRMARHQRTRPGGP